MLVKTKLMNQGITYRSPYTLLNNTKGSETMEES